jgi:dinuclear metal center YbgI/SA1388 family protein
MFALDASADVISQAVKADAQMLVTHHPMIFELLKQVDTLTPAGRALQTALTADLVVFSAHTNLDAAQSGMNRSLAKLVGLSDPVVLLQKEVARVKLVTFVPAGSMEAVKAAAFKAGAGQIGAYTRCSFTTPGTGTFLGGSGSTPAVGKAGREESVEEIRMETLVESENASQAIAAICAVHPYEKPAIDVYSLSPSGSPYGLGLVGQIVPSVTVQELAAMLANRLKTSSTRLVGSGRKKVSRVAVCAGSGASLLEAAIREKAELYITGDMKYHDARTAQEADICILDIGHFSPERFGLKEFVKDLKKRMKSDAALPEMIFAKEKDPFSLLV